MDPRLSELASWQHAKQAFAGLATLPLATKQEAVYHELVRLAAAALDPVTPSYEAAEVYLGILESELATDGELAARLYDAMTGPPPATGTWVIESPHLARLRTVELPAATRHATLRFDQETVAALATRLARAR